MLESLNGVQEGGGGRVGGRYNGGFGTGPPLPPKETHRYRIALPGLTGQNSPTIGGEGKRGGGEGEGEEFSALSREIRCGGAHETGPAGERERERAQRGLLAALLACRSH